ncbi:thioredoxin-disulfide reductase [Clostridium botulinum]|uniref:Thioredoxin reductase n=1 Tax=Clostridium botulinum (strain Hall / ATCC 3502 / NCTC 13319 / Type A) TaxID=441771 RepID=A5I198_CLOBH|nr:thioredoxin-disulfide reductase [Clostridium botulinum]ABS34158.1 thioredoxin-disulfide reductase [Clostridium botulinum A str. ATCC 19397]ABS37586.1 thioredoxin-disulfide reductase [Clostridium botulinum A str. Hall]APQ95327.1 thioredoxin-disulfide reductase [Clostridium botulinum]AWB17173.1 thioredoxin-disulfide reductase [Clostridium botulinum]AWB29968.1 thioredoxin-disulfide reductase [Clostridium botulinum]
MDNVYDLIIIGSGPAGLSAGLYAARARLKTLILERNKAGGQIVITDEVANYPGSIRDATGASLVARMEEQVDEFGAERKKDNVKEVDFTGKIKIIKGEKEEYKAKSVIIATGAAPRHIGCKGENELIGKGVSYCATCDADFFTDLEVFVIGGGDSALEEALYLTKFARKVTVVHRRDALRGAKSIQEKVFKNPKIEIMWDSVVEEIKGDGIVESAVFKNKKTGEITEYFADEDDGTFGIFVFVGYLPINNLFKDIVTINEAGYIKTNDRMETNIEGIFAAGDIREKSLRQVVTAAADGAIAAVEAYKYVEDTF